MSQRTFFAVSAVCALLSIPAARAAEKKTPAPAENPQAGQNIDAIAEAVFKKADRNVDKKLNQSEFRGALTMTEQVALTMPPKHVNTKNINPQAAALGAPAAGMPDFSNGKHLSLDEFKALFPGLLSQAEDQLAQLRAQQAAAASKAPMRKRKGY